MMKSFSSKMFHVYFYDETATVHQGYTPRDSGALGRYIFVTWFLPYSATTVRLIDRDEYRDHKSVFALASGQFL